MDFFHLDQKISLLAEEAEKESAEAFERIYRIQRENEQKVLHAFIKHRVSQAHFAGSTGYGYGDRGREVLDQVYAEVFGAQDAIVRHQFVSGTHALTVALFALLRPGDILLSATGAPYDTMEQVIFGKDCGSLADFNVGYRQVSLLKDGAFDLPKILSSAEEARVIYIQRSRGYSSRPAIGLEQIQTLTREVKKKQPDAVILVDNCYGEFTDVMEPNQVGADLSVGSLIKNPGGGVATTGGYIVGQKKWIELCAQRLTAPGVGKDAGCTLQHTREMCMGLFFAPSVVASALKASVFAGRLFTKMGYTVCGDSSSVLDVITAVELGDEESLVSFCKGIQSGSPVDSFVEPLPWEMPGYPCKVIMAAGGFTEGSSIELSADGPLRPPYTAYLQGGLTYETAKIGILQAAQNLINLKKR